MATAESLTGDQDLEAMEAMYGKMFDDRYSNSDVEFMATVNTPLPDPPCVHNWFTRPKRDFNRGGWRGGGRGGGRDQGHHHGNRGGYHDRQRNYDRREQGQGFDRQQYRDYHGNRGRGHDRYRDRYHPYGDRRH